MAATAYANNAESTSTTTITSAAGQVVTVAAGSRFSPAFGADGDELYLWLWEGTDPASPTKQELAVGTRSGNDITLTRRGVQGIWGSSTPQSFGPSSYHVVQVIAPAAPVGINRAPNGYDFHQLGGGARIGRLATPAAPTVSPQGTTGSTTWAYYVVARDRHGHKTFRSTVTQITNGNATLTGGNFNRITWSAVTGAYDYQIVRSTAAGTPSTTGLIATVLATATLQVDDTGLTASAYTQATVQDSGEMAVDGVLTVGDEDGVSDGSVWATSILRAGKNGGYRDNIATEFVATLQYNIGGDLGYGAAPYERGGLFILTRTADPSSAGLHDAVGADIRCHNIGTSTGRIWAVALQAVMDPGTDGLISALEHYADTGDAADQPAINTTTSKYSINMQAGGTNPMTVGMWWSGGVWHRMFLADPARISTHTDNAFLELTGKFRVRRDGFTTIGIGTPTTNPFSQLRVYEDGGSNEARVQIERGPTGGSGNAAAALGLRVSGEATDEKQWNFVAYTNFFAIQTVNDAGSVGQYAFRAVRSGVDPTQFLIPNGNVGIGGSGFGISPLAKLHVYADGDEFATFLLEQGTTAGTGVVQLILRDSGLGTDEKRWDTFVNGTTLQHRAVNDANSAANSWLEVVRSGYTISSVTIPSSNLVLGSTYKLKYAAGSAGQVLESDANGLLTLTSRPFSVPVTLLSPASGTTVMAWRAPFACTVTNVRAHFKSGTSVVYNARRNQSSTHLSSNQTASTADAWADGGSVQNTAYAAGDDLEVQFVTINGAVSEASIQVDFTRP